MASEYKYLEMESNVGLTWGLATAVGKTDEALELVNDDLTFDRVRLTVLSGATSADLPSAATEAPPANTTGSETVIVLPGVSIDPGTLIVPITFGGTEVDGPSTELTSLQIGTVDSSGTFVATFEATGLAPFTLPDLVEAMSSPNTIYEGTVALLDNDTTLTGTHLNDRLEVGAGNDMVQGLQGDDTVFKWRPGDLTFKGGQGRDTLNFNPDGQASPMVFTQTMTLTLKNGKGETAFGGKLKIKNVEVIRTVESDDHITGSAEADEIHNSFGGADEFRMRDGDDLVTLFLDFNETLVDGGKGYDRLELTTSGFGDFDPDKGFGRQRLDLGDMDNNLNDFDGLVVKNVEDVTVTMIQAGVRMQLYGRDAHERLEVDNFFAGGEQVTILAKGGRDTVLGGFGDDEIKGGDGADQLDGRTGNDALFGGKGTDTLTGGAGNDTLTGAKHADTFVFAAAFGLDEITDFEDGLDLLDFSGHATVSKFRDLTVKDRDAGARILDGEGNKLDLLGVEASDISKADFIF